jgi:hypothetical protein
LPCPVRFAKIFRFALHPNQIYIHRRPVPHRGAFRDRHGRRERDAMDADGAADESAVSRTAKSYGPDASTLASSWRETADDGDKKARSPGRVRRKPLKPLRAGMPGDPGATVVTTLVCYQHNAHEAAGATGTRHSPRPLFGAEFSCTTRAHRAAGTRSCVGECAGAVPSVVIVRQRVGRMAAR